MKKILSFVLLATLFSCSAQKELADKHPRSLSFGSSGGFTNQSITFELKPDGKLWKFKGLENDSSLVKQLKKSQAKKVFKQALQLGLDTLTLNSPGNMSNFIRLKSKTVDNKIVWATDSNEAPAAITEFYQLLINHSKPK
ncbi:MAG: hypothetical protein L3J31_05805 [Bacteroidales bacterium]|nr:hypothetical protein [Bacteroidales bacterium]MCF6342304.1 hypothetical protein [Bacteroidales bacterium]